MGVRGEGCAAQSHSQFSVSPRVPDLFTPRCSFGAGAVSFDSKNRSGNATWMPGEDVCVMAPARPFWKGYLKLSLVSCPIALFPASSSSERASFRRINRKTGYRLKQPLVDSVTGEVVESQDKGRG